MPGRRTARSADKQRRGPPCAASAAQTGLEQRLALLGALAALALRAAEELCELVVAVALRIGPVLLHPQCVAQALLGEPDEVVVLVLRASDLATLCRHRLPPRSTYRRLSPTLSPIGDAGLPNARSEPRPERSVRRPRGPGSRAGRSCSAARRFAPPDR